MTDRQQKRKWSWQEDCFYQHQNHRSKGSWMKDRSCSSALKTIPLWIHTHTHPPKLSFPFSFFSLINMKKKKLKSLTFFLFLFYLSLSLTESVLCCALLFLMMMIKRLLSWTWMMFFSSLFSLKSTNQKEMYI